MARTPGGKRFPERRDEELNRLFKEQGKATSRNPREGTTLPGSPGHPAEPREDLPKQKSPPARGGQASATRKPPAPPKPKNPIPGKQGPFDPEPQFPLPKTPSLTAIGAINKRKLPKIKPTMSSRMMNL